MAGSWRVATGGGVRKMEKQQNLAAFASIYEVLAEFQIKGASLFDHAPVLRIQVSEPHFARAIALRENLVERIKPLGYRFIALDLDVPAARE